MQGVPRLPSGTHRPSDSGWTALTTGWGAGRVRASCIHTKRPVGQRVHTASRAESGLGDPGSTLDSTISQLGDAGMGFPVSSSAKWER